MKKIRNVMSILKLDTNEFLLKMKLLTLMLFVAFVSASASSYSQATKFNLEMKDVTIGEVFQKIEQQSEFVILYNEKTLNINRKVNVIIAKDETVDKILDQIFEGQKDAYVISGPQILINKMADIPKIPPSEIKNIEVQQPRKKELSGTVKDVKGMPLPGTTVIAKGTTVGTITDADGKFTLNIPVDAKILTFSFVGMVTQEITIGNQTNLIIALKETTVDVGEVVVVGYGVQKKQSVVGSISQVTNEQLKRSGNVTDLKQALTGQLPGLVTITSSGEPGGTGRGESATQIYIRGQNTWNGGQPLILVDGVERRMDNLDVNDVENISILKDASATAVFGVKGANGVILITSKRGKIGKPKIDFSYNATAKMLSKFPKSMDSYNGILIRDLAIEREVVLNEPSWGDYMPNEIANRYKLPQTAEYAMIYPNVDWQKAIYKDVGMSHRATLNVQGGTNFVKYFGSFAYLNEGDMFKKYENHKGYDPNYNFNRFNFRSNLDFKLTKTTNLKVNLSGYYSLKNTNYNNEGSSGNADYYMWGYIYAPDLYLPQYPDGRFGYSTLTPVTTLLNPVIVNGNYGMRQTRTTQLNSDFAFEQNLDFLTRGLSAKALLSYDNSILSEGGILEGSVANTPSKFINPLLYKGPDQNPSEYTTLSPTLGTNQFDFVIQPVTLRPEVISAANWTTVIPIERRMTYQFQLNYARKFKEHNIGALGVFKREEYANGSEFKHFREDLVFRGTYDYATRYLLEMNGAYNGSEQFGPGYRFAFFPSLAAGWVVSNEKFFKVDFINRLKLRVSSGKVGDDRVSGGRWLYSSQLTYGGSSKLNQNPNNTSPYTWYKDGTVGNPNLHWEKAQKNDYGVEMGLFNDIISVNYDYFTEDRTDILLEGGLQSIPPYYGGIPPSANLGRVKSSGHEIELKFNSKMTGGFHYWAALAVTHTKNEILAKDDPALMPSYLKAQGYPVGQTHSQVRTGFNNNWDRVYGSAPLETNDLLKLPGDYNIADINADGIIKGTDDSAPFGYTQIPENTFNFTIGGDYKGFSVMIQFYGVNNVSSNIPLPNFSGGYDLVFDHVSDHWSKDNQNATSFVPRWKTTGGNIGDYYIYDASYLRLKTAEIAYTFQDKWVKKAGLSALKIFLNGNDLFFWSKLPDDREATFSGGTATRGSYPTVKRINLGFDLTF